MVISMIRKANIEDARSIVYINTMMWKKTYKGIFPDEFLNNLDLHNEIAINKCKNKINEYAVYEIDNKVVGFIRYGLNRKNYDNTYAEVYALYIDSFYQRKGIGKELINYVFNELKNNYKYVLISTLKDNNANIFYQKIGGKYIGTCNFILEDNKYIENIYKFDL